MTVSLALLAALRMEAAEGGRAPKRATGMSPNPDGPTFRRSLPGKRVLTPFDV